MLVLGVIGVSSAVILAVTQGGDDGGADISWPAVGGAAIGVLAVGALFVVFESLSISVRKFGDRSMGQTEAHLRALAAFLAPATYRQAAAMTGIPAVVLFGLVWSSLLIAVVFVVRA